MKNDRLSNKVSVCDHEKATPYLEISDFSQLLLLSNLTISRNVQFPNINRFDNRFDIQFPPTGGPRIRKLAIFAETRKTGKTRKTRNFSARFLIWKSDENGSKIASFASFSSFASFRENCQFPDARAAGRAAVRACTENHSSHWAILLPTGRLKAQGSR